MTLEAAIRNLEELKLITHYYHSDIMKEALNLGIEALKRKAEESKFQRLWTGGPLPGETEV